MSKIPLEKLTKDELITLINTHSFIRKPDATRIYYESRSKKNQAEQEKVSAEIDKVLSAQIIAAKEYNECRHLTEKMRLASKLSRLKAEWNTLNTKWEKLYKQSQTIFKDCYGDIEIKAAR